MTTRRTGPRAGRFTLVFLLLLLAPLLAQAGSPLRAFAAPAAATCSGTATPALTEGPYYKAGLARAHVAAHAGHGRARS